jgi:hypothetical protein
MAMLYQGEFHFTKWLDLAVDFLLLSCYFLPQTPLVWEPLALGLPCPVMMPTFGA